MGRVTEPAEGAEFVQLVGGFERLVGLLRRRTTPDGMSLTAASTLYRLYECGAHRLSDLAVAEGVTQPGMTQLVSRLERDGLAERRADPADGRVVLVEITAAGRERVLERRRARADKLAELLVGLPAEDRAAILRALQVVERITEVSPAPSSGRAPASSSKGI